MPLDLDGSDTLHEQLARALPPSILQGGLKAGSRLPVTRDLAAELGVSRNTVLTAYEMLCAELSRAVWPVRPVSERSSTDGRRPQLAIGGLGARPRNG